MVAGIERQKKVPSYSFLQEGTMLSWFHPVLNEQLSPTDILLSDLEYVFKPHLMITESPDPIKSRSGVVFLYDSCKMLPPDHLSLDIPHILLFPSARFLSSLIIALVLILSRQHLVLFIDAPKNIPSHGNK